MASVAPILILLALVALNGFFVAAEFALVAAPRPAVERRAALGQRRARLVVQILRSPKSQDRFFATSQLGVTLASLGLGMYGEHVLASWFAAGLEGLGASRWIAAHAVASVLAVTVLTYFHVVIGEVLPKSLALQFAGRLVLWITPIMTAVRAALFPAVVLLHGLTGLVLRLFGVRRQPNADRFYTPEELQFIVEESEESGLLKADAGRMLGELLEFGDLTAGQVMVPRVRVLGLPAGATAAEVQETLRRSAHTRYPIYERDLDHILGMVHVKDLLPRLRAGEPIAPSLVRPLPVVPETAALDAVLAAMRRGRSQMAIVIDEHGGTAGIVTLEDLFEEVVGEIDESQAPPPAVLDARGRHRVKGTLRLDELGQLFDRELGHEEVESVSGLVLMLLDRPPKVGDVVLYDGLRLEVTAVQGHGVRECAVSIAQGTGSGGSGVH